MKRSIFLIIFALCLASVPVSAHVLLRDTRANIGVVMHITPDDDPVAGKQSQLYFDVQDSESRVSVPYGAYELLVTDENTKTNTVTVQASGNTLTANYTFPVQGLYKLQLRSRPNYDPMIHVSIAYSIRVNRGTVNQARRDQNKHPLAEYLSPISAAGLAAVAIIGFNNRKEIIRHSKF